MRHLNTAFLVGLVLAGISACRTQFVDECPDGTEGCECVDDETCLDTLDCLSGVCVSPDGETGSESVGDGDSSSSSGDGDGDSSTGDGDATTGDGDATTGDGDGDSTTGDGDGDSTTGDGDGDSTTGDGDGDSTTGDGDATTGDGDGDSTTGDGDGDSTTGDGDGDSTTGDGDGDSTTGDGDGDSTTGDGDGDSTTGDGDGDSTTGDGDGDGGSTTGDGDGDGGSTTGDGDSGSTTGDGDGDGDAPNGANWAFHTSTSYSPDFANFGMSARQYASSLCATAAQDAGLSGTFVAILADDTDNGFAALGTSQGWYRPDGLPVAETKTQLLADEFFYPLDVNELGEYPAVQQEAWTGIGATSNFHDDLADCDGWTNATAGFNGRVGDSNNSIGWLSGGNARPCSLQKPLYCFGIDNIAAVAPDTPTGSIREMFITSGPQLAADGFDGWDAVCQSEFEAENGTATGRNFQALAAIAGSSALSRFDTTAAAIHRPDGVLLWPSLSSLSAGDDPLSFPEIGADGNRVVASVWTGGTTPGTPGAAGEDCSGWTLNISTVQARIGFPYDIGNAFSWVPRNCDNTTYAVYCLEELP